jgi:hypothetical protein
MTCVACGATSGRLCPMSTDGEGPHVYNEPAPDWVAQAEARDAAAAEQQLRERDDRILAIPQGTVFLAGKLQPAFQPPFCDEVLHRWLDLQVFLKQTQVQGVIFGDLSKGSRSPSPEEVLRLSGRQRNGVPCGLVQCATCGDWTGDCFDPSPHLSGRIVRVHCPCENDNLCATCGKILYGRKLNANYYNPADGEIWHVPGFSGLSHECSASSGSIE